MSDIVEKLEHGFKSTVYQHAHLASKAIVVMAHGAGAGNRNEFMDCYCTKLAESQIKVISFNFDYMQIMYESGKRRPPNPNKQLLIQFNQVLSELNTNLPVFIAGKSMGGRVASQLAATSEIGLKIQGCIVLGYPFMPPGKPEKFADRTQHFIELAVPLLINQGERDTFGGVDSLSNKSHEPVLCNSKLQLKWIPSGDHSFKPLKSSGVTIEENIQTAVSNTVKFIHDLV